MLFTALWSNDNLKESSSLFKKGFDSLISDMQQIKENNHKNSIQIEALNKKFDYIVSNLQKKTVAASMSSSEMIRLKDTISSLEEQVQTLQLALDKQSKKVLTIQRKSNKEVVVKDEQNEYYKPKTKEVIVSDDALDKIEQNKLAAYSIQVGIFRKQKSLNNAKSMYEKLIDSKNNKIIFEPCRSCKNDGLTKVIIEGFESKKQAKQFVKINHLKNSMIIDNRG